MRVKLKVEFSSVYMEAGIVEFRAGGASKNCEQTGRSHSAGDAHDDHAVPRTASASLE
jgi:hypothetical protein